MVPIDVLSIPIDFLLLPIDFLLTPFDFLLIIDFLLVPIEILLVAYKFQCRILTPSPEVYRGKGKRESETGGPTSLIWILCFSLRQLSLQVMKDLPAVPSIQDSVVTVRGIRQRSTTPVAAFPP